MFRNIVFDLGGVMVEFEPRSFLLERFCSESIENAVYDIVFGSEEWKKRDAGLLTATGAGLIMLEKARQKGLEFEVRTVLEDWEEMFHTKRRTVEYARRLKKAGFNIFYLSNISHETLAVLQERDFWALFQGGVASCDEHICKPDARIFQILLNRYHLVPNETIFIDDNVDNAHAAMEQGITAIHCKGSNSLARGLASCGISFRERFPWQKEEPATVKDPSAATH